MTTKYFKTLLVFLLSAGMILSFAACGNTDDETSTEEWEGFEQTFPYQGEPMTYFVDSQGKLIGTTILGAQTNVYPKVMEDLLSEAE